MKHSMAGILLFFIALFVYTKLAGPIPFSVTSVTTTKSDTFNVTGEGKVNVIPDIATIMVGVTGQGATVTAAQNTLNTDINKVTEAIKRLGIEAKDIKTSNYNIQPVYDYRSTPQKITGYNATSNLTIKVKNTDRVNSVIDAATGNGANLVSGVTFDVADKTKAENEARKEAVADAKAKAENAAKIAGFTLGRIINYSENFGGNPRPVLMAAKADGLGGGSGTQIEPGTSEINLAVSLSYEIR